MKNILAFDTSSPVLSLALKKGQEPVLAAEITGFLQHAENLLPLTDKLLKTKKLSIYDIDVFLIGRGPGSFTGLRIGFATLKGLLVTKKKPCFGALSLDMIAENCRLPESSHLAVCLDARREKIYTRFYLRKKSAWVSKGKAAVLDFEVLTLGLPPESYIAGDALIRYGEKIKEFSSGKKIHFLPESDWYPKAATLIRWYNQKSKNIQQLKKPKDFLPLYFRLSVASAKKSSADPSVLYGGEEKSKPHASTC